MIIRVKIYHEYSLQSNVINWIIRGCLKSKMASPTSSNSKELLQRQIHKGLEVSHQHRENRTDNYSWNKISLIRIKPKSVIRKPKTPTEYNLRGVWRWLLSESSYGAPAESCNAWGIPEKALQLYYESHTCADLHDKSTGLYLYGDLYVADEFMREKEYAI